jgi:hypothetical protein
MQRAQGSGDEDDEDGFYRYHPGMMGGGMMGHGQCATVGSEAVKSLLQ